MYTEAGGSFPKKYILFLIEGESEGDQQPPACSGGGLADDGKRLGLSESAVDVVSRKVKKQGGGLGEGGLAIGPERRLADFFDPKSAAQASHMLTFS